MERWLSELRPGERGVVVRVVGERKLRRRILDMGIVSGTEIEVVRVAPLGDPVEFRLKGYELSLRRAEAENVLVHVGGSESSKTAVPLGVEAAKSVESQTKTLKDGRGRS
ncbi:MAG: iron transporter [Candidatus Alkanophagales archaeon]|nr:MAG: iron transporter [Candidatus Alkanophagales archaeon]